MKGLPVAGRDYPGSLPELRSWYRSDADCLDYLDWLRWPDGFVCPWCAGVGEWAASPGVHRCSGCSRRVSVTAGTLFQGTRAPLTVWFEAAWLMTVSKQGLSAQTLQHSTGLGRYQTAWTMLHKFRTVMDPAKHPRLSGDVEVDETMIGGFKPVFKGRGAAGKTLVGGAIERRGRGFGRARLQIIADGTTPSLTAFLQANVAPGSRVISDGWSAYPPASRAAGLLHTAYKVTPSGLPAHTFLPGVHRLFSLVKRVLEGTYQGSVQPEHLQAYLDEFVFRFNRRNSTQRGLLFFRLLEASVAGAPATYNGIAEIHRTPPQPPVAPPTPHHLPRTLTGQPAHRPWRTKIP